MKIKILLIILTLLLVAAGCPEEREDLLNPPSFKDGVNIRFLNLSTGKLEFILDDSLKFGSTSYLTLTKSFNPTNDSAIVTIKDNGEQVYKSNRHYPFSRNLNFLFVGLPKPNSNNLGFDSLVSFTNLGNLNIDKINASVKILNAVPDTNSRILVQIGCPGGENFTPNPVSYREYTFSNPMKAGEEVSLSVIKINVLTNQSEVLGTYSYKFGQGEEYTIIAANNESNQFELFVLNENDFEQEALESLVPVEIKQTNVRLVNLTDRAISLIRNGVTELNFISGEEISRYVQIPACIGASSQTFSISSSTQTFEFSPTVNSYYDIIAFKSLETGADSLIFIEPPFVNTIRNNRALIRTLNLSQYPSGMNISLGANSSSLDTNFIDQKNRNYVSGTSIAKKLTYKTLTSNILINPGLKPFISLSSTEPGYYLSSFLYDLEPNENYLLISYKTLDFTRFTMLSRETSDGNIQFLNEGVFVGLINLVNNSAYSNFDLSTNGKLILNNSKLNFENSLSTILEEGDFSLKSNNLNYSAAINKNNRSLFILHNESSPEIFEITDLPINYEDNKYKMRFVNLSPDSGPIIIKQKTGQNSVKNLYLSLGYKQISSIVEELSDNRFSLNIFAEDDVTELFTSPDTPISRGKNYTVIFSGTKGNYHLTIYQEF